ncbi:MAG TPA: DUF504 domain-containing protein [Thermoprotei archaeon]|nr:DUF504 domain-containing protein [Thermoprotei archaeon]
MKYPKTARDTLLKIFWIKRSLEDVKVELLFRGAPNDKVYITGKDIKHIGRHWLVTYSAGEIPYHRVLRIYYKNKLVFSRFKGEFVEDINDLIKE